MDYASDLVLQELTARIEELEKKVAAISRLLELAMEALLQMGAGQ